MTDPSPETHPPVDPIAIFGRSDVKNLPWHELAVALKSLEKNGMADASGRPWIYIAGNKSKYGTNQLRRMTRVLDFLEHLQATGKITEAREYFDRRISSLDIINRLFSLDEALALKMLKSPDAEGSTYQGLVKKYERALAATTADHDSQRAGRRAERAFDKACFEMIKSAPSHFAEKTDVDVLLAYRVFKNVNPDFLLVHRDGGKITDIDAIICKEFSSTAHKRFFRQLVHEIAFEATFFRKFWVMISEGPICTDLLEELETSGGFENVGVAAVILGEKPGFFVVRRPTGMPVPDRRSVLKHDRLNA